MIETSYGGEQLFLVPFPADWSRPVRTEFRIPGTIHGGLSDREARYATGEALRLASYTFHVDLHDAGTRQMRDGLRAMTTERVAVPFWPGAMPQADYAATPVPGGLKISFEVDDTGFPDLSAFEIHPGRAPSGAYQVSARTWTAPLVLGYFLEDPQPNLSTDEFASVQLTIVEDGDVSEALTVDAQSFTAGPQLGGLTPKLFPLRHDFAESGSSGGARLPLERSIIGQGRERSTSYHGAAASRVLRLRVPLASLAEAAQLIRFLQDRRGIVESFWLPSYLSETRLQGDVSEAATVLQVEDSAALDGHGWVALMDSERIAAAAVASTGEGTITLSSAPGAFSARHTSLCALLLARMSKRTIAVDWTSAGTGSASIECRELDPEYEAAASETIGSTLGAVPALCSLYTFAQDPVSLGGTRPLEIAFVVDDTGSMGSIINLVKQSMLDIAAGFDELVPDVRYGLIRFKDENAVTLVSDFTDIDTINPLIQAITTSGGGDTPEAGYLATKVAAEGLTWNNTANPNKVIVLFTDAPSHERGATEAQAISAVLAEGIRFFYGTVMQATYQGLVDATDGGFVAGGQNFVENFLVQIGSVVETEIWRLTSYERDLEFDGETYLAVPITHGDIERTITLEDRASIDCEGVPEIPLLGFWQGTIPQLSVRIVRAQVSGAAASNGRTVFNGEILDCSANGTRIEARAVTIGRDFDGLVPRGKFQYPCAYALYAGGCALDARDWTFEATVETAGAAAYPYALTLEGFVRLNGQSLPTGFGAEGWFAWGVLDFGGVLVPVRTSSAIDDGKITVALGGVLNPWPDIDDTVRFRPGCDGQAGTCADKFDNFPNWGGHYPAAGNLSLVKVSSDVGGGKK